MSDSDASFLSRWSRRKAAVREGKTVPAEAQAPAQPTQPPQPPLRAVVPPSQEPMAESAPLPTLADVAQLRPGDNIARFVAQGVDESVKRAALKTLFADPHFNVMDGLDTYIDDYTKPDPIPLDVLRKLTQSEALGLFDSPEEDVQAQQRQADEASAPAPEAAPDSAENSAEKSPEKSAEISAEGSAAESAPESAASTAADKHA